MMAATDDRAGATGNLPVVLSELGSRAGVTGAAVLASDTCFEQAS